jgi:hypothetical protein
MWQEILPLMERVSVASELFELANPGAGHVQVVHECTGVVGELYQKVVISGRYGDTYIALVTGSDLVGAGCFVYGLGPLALVDAVHGVVFAGLVPDQLRVEVQTITSGTDRMTSRVQVHWLGVP